VSSRADTKDERAIAFRDLDGGDRW
jgi:hypothetical protein